MANNILPFCGTDTGTNLLTQLEYAASTDRTSGNKPGVASADVSDRQMRDQCQARVAEMYAVPSGRIRLAAIRKDRQGPRIDGRVDKGAEGIKKFRCLYTSDRRLRDVMALTPDGE